MRKLFTIFCGFASGLILFGSVFASGDVMGGVGNPRLSSYSVSGPGSGSDQLTTDSRLTDRILYLASFDLEIPYPDLCDMYASGLVTITKISATEYLVDAGHGNIAVVVLDSL